ncbi:Rv3654c family TadE-like protein [Actinomyces mediterranea]|uniref:Rv3654c family TadE-like protein n=1 Tax=Actinomyces mediterranea TaxID=1871028 RepID=UPI001F3FEA0A|nr:Rv3654c family TadE-like protein [Actinomyces mediterranea]
MRSRTPRMSRGLVGASWLIAVICMRIGMNGERRDSGLRRGERGSGTVLVAGIVACALVLAIAVGAMGDVYAARARVEAVGDLAALAGGDASATAPFQDVGSRPCDQAATVAQRNSMTLESCEVVGADTRVIVSDATVIAGWSVTLRARSRAGPEESSIRGD